MTTIRDIEKRLDAIEEAIRESSTDQQDDRVEAWRNFLSEGEPYPDLDMED